MSADGARADNIRPSATLGDPPRDQRGEEGEHPRALNALALGRWRVGSQVRATWRASGSAVPDGRPSCPNPHLARTRDRATPFKGGDGAPHGRRRGT
eukprot:1851103-Prymnesium_polylepis.1